MKIPERILPPPQFNISLDLPMPEKNLHKTTENMAISTKRFSLKFEDEINETIRTRARATQVYRKNKQFHFLILFLWRRIIRRKDDYIFLLISFLLKRKKS